MSTMAVPADVFDAEAAALLASRCGDCASIHFPPIDGCPDCFAPDTERVALSQTGEVRSHTVVNLGFPGYPQGYVLAEVLMPEGVVVLGQLAGVDGNTVCPGLRVRVECGPIRLDGDGKPVDGYRFTPSAQEV